ncbi:MAG: GEGP motif-containing diheme protein [Desulfobulbaceae bacterium]|nr:GEGP motif-containing diheme protein [Desulfobulbaceae bacterium]
MKMSKAGLATVFVLAFFPGTACAAYHHMGELDSDRFIFVYPEMDGTKLDSCTLCHSGGQYLNSRGVWVVLGSCQWCHYKYGYDASGEIDETMNQYGRDFRDTGRNEGAVAVIEQIDSDGDGFVNIEEIAAIRYPGDSNDDPTKVPAPYRIYTRGQLETLPQHSQFMLMNTHKSADFYAEYTGVPMEALLQNAGILDSATGIQVYAADGWAQYHPLTPDPDPLLYHVYGSYPPAPYYYDAEADIFLNADYGWCDYDAPSNLGREHGDAIENEHGLKMVLAITRDGESLDVGELGPDNKLDGEGPFRVVPPQKNPGPPDQRSTSGVQDVIWPFDNTADHNAGYSSRTVTMVKVEPLPEGTTDIDILEAGWNFVDENRIMVYGAIDPIQNVLEKLDELIADIRLLENEAFKKEMFKLKLEEQTAIALELVQKGEYKAALNKMRHVIMKRMDGCVADGSVAGDDWLNVCESQKKMYWQIHEITVLTEIAASKQY